MKVDHFAVVQFVPENSPRVNSAHSLRCYIRCYIPLHFRHKSEKSLVNTGPGAERS